MSTWNYRLVRYRDRHDELWYGIHEVYYDKTGKAWGMTANAVTFQGENPDDVIEILKKALHSAMNRPIFDEPEPGQWPGKAPGVKR